ncbi:MAG: hypothetical protein WCO79_00745 [bacterium]
MPPKKKRPTPLLVALAVTSAHNIRDVPPSAVEVIAAKVIGGSRLKTDTFYQHTTNIGGSALLVAQDFVKWLVHHTESPLCVVVGLERFANTALGRMIGSCGQHLKVYDLASMVSGQALDLAMVIEITENIAHGAIDATGGHIPPRREVDFIEAQLKERFKGLLPLTMRKRRPTK